ncbi:hypothetical protein HJC99_06470 [Candidatus Saccharibacteria bacterium]|nr:hypothetical protein [Candidatus Saccharibacteria bacterium]
MERLCRAARVLGLPLPVVRGSQWRQLIIGTILAVQVMVPGAVHAVSGLTNVSVALSDPRPNATAASVTYQITASGVTAATVIKCVKVLVSTTSAGTVAPTGFSGASSSVTAASSTLINSSATGWSLAKSDGTSSTGQNNILQYTNSTGITPSTLTGATFIVAGLTNSTVGDTPYFLQLATFGATDCVTGPVNNSLIRFINTSGSQLSLSVDPTLTFTVNGVLSGQACDGSTSNVATTSTTLAFGSVTTATNSLACQDLTAATNASNGYTIYMRYSGQLNNGSGAFIANVSGSNSSPGTFPAAGNEAYGYTTSDATLGTGTANRFTSPSQGWAAPTTTNAEIAYESGGVTSTTYRIGHQIGVATTTRAGSYQTTIIYTCTPVY